MRLCVLVARITIQPEAKGPGKRGHIVAHDVSWTAQTGKHLWRTQNVSEQSQKHFFRTQNFCPQQMLRARANGETICVGNNVSSFAKALSVKSVCIIFCMDVVARVYSTTILQKTVD